MPKRTSKSGSELFIVDNSDDDWKVLRYLHDWCQISKSIDIASGYFEIGALLALQDEWQKVDGIRILIGDEVSKRTKAAFVEGLRQVTSRLDASLEAEKEKNDFLAGVPAVVEAIRSGKIQCRVYRKDKFHAKCYLTHARQEVVGSFALVGSSNFTYPGLTENVELNVQITGTPVAVIQEWYEHHWNDAEDVTAEILRVIERQIQELSPFIVYVKALQEYCRGHEATAHEWETAGPERGSRVFPILDVYQQEGYHALMQIARGYGGAFLCDGVGLGKTFVGLMLIERLIVHQKKRVVLFAPKTTVEDVWKPHIRDYLPHIGSGDYSSLAVFNHTDLWRGGEFPERLERIQDMADVIIVDEAHHFRNPGRTGDEGGTPSRYRRLFDMVEGPQGNKEVFLLTATPINNRLHDFRHMAELFTRRQDDYFARSFGVHSLRGHFVKMERDLEAATTGDGTVSETNLVEAEQVLKGDRLFKELVVQRSRAYVRQSQLQQGRSVASFPEREPPRVADYSVKATYGRLLDLVDAAFHRETPLFVLGIYYPLAYLREAGTGDPWEDNRQKQVCALIRTQFLKRFESSAHAFEQSCNRLLTKLLAWVKRHSETDSEKRRLERWMQQHAALIGYYQERQRELFADDDDEDEADEDFITPEMLEAVEYVDRDKFKVEDILADTFLDLDEIAKFMDELKRFQPKHDDKLKALVKLLRTDPVIKQHKVLIFSEFAETARYLREQLVENGIDGIEQLDSGNKKNRREIIRRFAPYYNRSSSADLAEDGLSEIRVLISTDVLSEGLNLQDATRLINYDLHWNPVRLMQRIGRVDRRMNPSVEERLLADHPDQKSLRGKIIYWNFLPPAELETLLRLYGRVSQKTLRISRTLGIEGKKLLRPEDDFNALIDFNHAVDGVTTSDEEMRLELQRLLEGDPSLEPTLDALPGRAFSGKEHPRTGSRAVFFCYRLPRPDLSVEVPKGAEHPWTEAAGETRWYLYELDQQRIFEEPAQIVSFIRCPPDTPRHTAIERQKLADIRKEIDKHIKTTFLKRMVAPAGVKPVLKAWMELS